MMGQVVKSSNESVINVNDLAKGTYAVRVLTRSGKVMVANVVIAR